MFATYLLMGQNAINTEHIERNKEKKRMKTQMWQMLTFRES